MEFTLIQKGSEVSCKSILQPEWQILYCQRPCYQKRKKYQAVQKIDIWFQLEGKTANQEQLISKPTEKLVSGQVERLDASFPLKRQNVIGIMVIDNSLNQKRSIKDKNASKTAQQLTNGQPVIFTTSFILDFFLKSNSTSMFPNAQNSLVLLNRLPFQALPTIPHPTAPRKYNHSTTLLSPQNHNPPTYLTTPHHYIYTLRPLKFRIEKITLFAHPNLYLQGHSVTKAQGGFKKTALKAIEPKQRRQKIKAESVYLCSSQENQAKLQDLSVDRCSFQNRDLNKSTFCLSQSTQIMLDDFLDDDLLAFKRTLKQLRKSDLFSFFQCWDSALEEYLTRVLQNWDLYQKTVKKDLTLFLRMNEYKMLKSGCSLVTTFSNQLTTPFYDLIYPNLRAILKQTINILELQSLEALKNRFINSHREDGKTILCQKQSVAIFLEQVKNDLRIEPQKKADIQLYQLLEELHSNLQGRSQLNPSFLAEFEKALSSALLQSLSSGNLLSIYDNDSSPSQNLVNQLIFTVKEQIQAKNLTIFKETVEKQRARMFMNELQNQKLTDANCLGCSKFFYLSMNVFDLNLCKVPLKAFSSIETITQIQNELKDSICAMLNCGGGIILFDCQLSSRQLVAKGYFLTELKKESEERRIGSYLQSFYPPLELNKNIQISFVPIVSSPLSSDRDNVKKSYTGEQGTVKQYEWYYERSYVRGYYVTRIRVKPSNGTQVFYWYKSKKSGKEPKEEEIIDKYCCAFDGEKIKYLKIQEMTKLIKRKFRSYFAPSSLCLIEKMLMTKPFDVFGHECLKPENGVQVAESDIKQIKSEVLLKDLFKRVCHTSHEYRYPNMILLIVHKKHLDAIKQKLTSLNVSCEIERRFQAHNLRPAFNTAILYHDKVFDILHKHLANDQQFTFANSKPMLLIQIKAYLKFERDMKNFPSKDDIQRYQSWLKKEFPNEKLKLVSYSLDRRRKQFYLTTESKLSTLFMYFMMGHHGEKIVFRNPLCIDKPQNEATNRLEVLYESPSG